MPIIAFDDLLILVVINLIGQLKMESYTMIEQQKYIAMKEVLKLKGLNALGEKCFRSCLAWFTYIYG